MAEEEKTKKPNFHELALEGLQSGIVIIDLDGKVRACNRAAKSILQIDDDDVLEKPCAQIFAAHGELSNILIDTCATLRVVNRKDMIFSNPARGNVKIGYGTLVLKDKGGKPTGVGMIFQDITKFTPLPLTTQFMSLFTWFFTPFAIIMVASALYFGYAENWEKMLSVGLLILVTIYNIITVYISKRQEQGVSLINKLHTPVNFIATATLIYLLGSFWGPMWLLLVLTPIAVALYGSKKLVLMASVVSAGLLLGIYAVRELSGPVGWGMASIHALFIIFIAMFVNSVANLASRIRSAK
ncbi:PAS domain-containing protein [Elusimicrobiota bacterium]